MSFQPASSLRSRTFVGLLIAQFFAAFNDQAIHAAGMFYAINQQALTEAQAISLMPILFYAPWVLFATGAGYFADRYSKRHSLVFWKVAEVAITLVTLAGFWLGTVQNSSWGPWVVLATVFLMGMHSTFFVPAKYGVMPEILQPHLLSRGNGLLESLSFLAIILGTVCGGVLSTWCEGREYIIGLVLFTLAVVGAFASLLIETMPAADPNRRFPPSVYGPLFANLRTMVRSKPLGLAVLGIAFFTFVVVFMRMAVYMLGESQVPRWTEQQTSIIVGMTALGIGLGSPLAGWLSGHKIEVGLVPLGGLGMILATLLAAFALDWLPNLVGLVAGIILIGFFTGFYLVPMFTLLQHRAPKSSKGDLVATNNCISVAGAILASIVFFGLERGAEALRLAEPVEQALLTRGTLTSLSFVGGRPQSFAVRDDAGQLREWRDGEAHDLLTTKKGFLKRLEEGDRVDVGEYQIGTMTYTTLRLHKDAPLPTAYNKSRVPRYLFVGAAVITFLILVLLRLRLPDLLLRTFLWKRALGRYRLRVAGSNQLPSDGPVLLISNVRTVDGCLEVLAATDRYTRVILPQRPADVGLPFSLRLLLRRSALGVFGEDEAALTERAARALERGDVVLIPRADGVEARRLGEALEKRAGPTVVLAHFDGEPASPQGNGQPVGDHRVTVTFSTALAGVAAAATEVDRLNAAVP